LPGRKECGHVQRRELNAYKKDLVMFCWGKIAEGQLGLGGTEDDPFLVPRNVDDNFGTLSEIKDIVCGWEHTAVLKNDGVVYTCGSNENGQLGHHKDGKKLG